MEFTIAPPHKTKYLSSALTTRRWPWTNDFVTTYETPLAVLAGCGVLTNDRGAEDDPLTAILDSSPAGDLDFSRDGSFVYTPTAGFAGSDTFTYCVQDGLDSSAVATVTINVLDASDAEL